MKRLLFLFCLLVVSHAAWTQHSSNAYRDLADSLYRHHHYQDAAVYYQRAIKKSQRPGSMMLWVAKSYLKINSLKEAEQWFDKAKANQGEFTHEDTYSYAQVLMMLQKRSEAVKILEELLIKDRNALQARQMIDDIQNFKKYFKDSSGYEVVSLPINTPVSEFAPAFYKDGIVFSAATQEKFAKRKYHWDNSEYLNLYFSKRTDGNFGKPVLFEKDFNTKFHDGPAVFYSGDERMIVNRNQAVKSEGKQDTWVWHLALYDASYLKTKSAWDVVAMPFDQPPYSFAHPFITQGGTTLFFISDIPGGYGGTDIYRVIKVNGVWGKPFNLGPAVNTVGNEVFPYYIDNTLYFASNGHGGLGGLDIFKSQHAVNGFGPPVNLGAPINSTADDFSFITRGDLHSGYFSSGRNGNDDLFSFRKTDDVVHLAAHIYDGQLSNPLAGAAIQLITLGEDGNLVSNDKGDFFFDLPTETAYVLIGSKNGKVGMISGSADFTEDKNHIVHQMPLFGDTTRVACIGSITDESGMAQKASSITIFDETSGKRITHSGDQSMVTFLGEKDHAYRVEIRNDRGDTTSHRMTIKPDDAGSTMWNMVMKESRVIMNMAARVFNAENNEALGGANVKIITFDEPDQELTAGADGVVEFQLVQGTAYVVIGSKDNLTGMHSGVVDPGTDKGTIVHPVPAHGDPPPKEIPVVALVTNADGKILQGAEAIVTDRKTGETITAKIEDGVLTFPGERGKEYNISVTSLDHESTLEEITVPLEGPEVEKISVVLEKTVPPSFLMAARVFKASDQSPLGGADVKIISFIEPDQELVANNDGVVEFTLQEGTAYMVVGSKDGFVGMHSGMVEKGTDKASVIHPVPANDEPQTELAVVGNITNDQGESLADASVTVIEKSTGKEVPVQVKEGLLNFSAEKGKDYAITVRHDDHQSETEHVSIPAEATDVHKISISMEGKKPEENIYDMAAHVFKATDHVSLGGADIKIISFVEPDQELTANSEGIVDFSLPEGTAYMIVASKDGYVGMHSGMVEKGTEKTSVIHPIPAQSEPVKELPVIGRITNTEGEALTNAVVSVTETSTGKKVDATVNEGIVSFSGEKGKDYSLVIGHKDHRTNSETIHIPDAANDVQKISFELKKDVSAPVLYQLAARVFNASNNEPLGGANVKVISFTEPDIELVANAEGIVDFALHDGTAFMIVGTKDGFVGMYSGTAGPDSYREDKQSVIHPVPANDEPKEEVPVVGQVVSDSGEALENALVTVTEKASGKKVESIFKDGLLRFSGKKGKDYSFVIEHKDHHTNSETIHIPDAANDVQKISFELKKDVSDPVLYQLAARVFNASNNEPLGGANVKVISFTEPDLELVANAEGIVAFALHDGTAFMIVGTKDGFVGMYSGTVGPDSYREDKQSVIHPVPANDEPKHEVPVVGQIVNDSGEALEDAVVTVTEKASGKKVESIFKDGLLSFSGEKGKDYNVTANHEDHDAQTKTVSIPGKSGDVHKISIELERKEKSSTTLVSSRVPQASATSQLSTSSTPDPVTYLMAARVFRTTDQSPLSGAEIRIISFIDPDQELIADSEGLVDFKLQDGTAYMVVASKDGFVGMHSGMVEKGMDKSSVIHPVPASKDEEKSVPVIGRVADEYGEEIKNATLTITENSSGNEVPSAYSEGLFSFFGEKGKEYTVTTDHPVTGKVVQRVNVPSNGSGPHKVSVTVTTGKDLPSLIAMDSEIGVSKMFISTKESFAEIVEKEGSLYMQTSDESKLLGKGTIERLKNDEAFRESLGLSDYKFMHLGNIYFDFNTATLDDEDRAELNRVKAVLQRFPELKLSIGAHADDRGHEAYNLSLSKKRARAVGAYLRKEGIQKDRIMLEGFGETVPAVPCASKDCSENEHQRNRRAEFSLASEKKPSMPEPILAKQNAERSKLTYDQIIEKYGDKSSEGLEFKINIGAYRYNSTLTFKELSDLGTIESAPVNGITFYYLSSFTTLRSAEDVRAKVSERGIKDAWITLFYKGEKITLPEFIALIR